MLAVFNSQHRWAKLSTVRCDEQSGSPLALHLHIAARQWLPASNGSKSSKLFSKVIPHHGGSDGADLGGFRGRLVRRELVPEARGSRIYGYQNRLGTDLEFSERRDPGAERYRAIWVDQD